MLNTGKLKGKTLFITGGSRGIGKAIAIKAAKDGANIVIAAKTATTHPKLPGTIHTAVLEVEKAGGQGLACVVDVRNEEQVQSAINAAVDKFGGIDILINNASAISFTTTEETSMKKYDLMQSINTRGAYLVTKLCLPHLKKSSYGHVLNISPPLNMGKQYFGRHVGYSVSKFGMTLCALGMYQEFQPFSISVNTLWPKTMEKAGGKGLACVVDVRNDTQVKSAIETAIKKFGGIDIAINNASAMSFTKTEETSMAKYDLLQNVNTRGTYLVTRLCLPYLKKSSHSHVLNISPPLNVSNLYFGQHLAYSISKLGMTFCALGMYQELQPFNISINTLWPKTAIDTAAIRYLGGEEVANYCRTPEIMADAAYAILTKHPKPSGEFLLDEDVLYKAGVKNFDQYLVNPEFKDKLALSYSEKGTDKEKLLTVMFPKCKLQSK